MDRNNGAVDSQIDVRSLVKRVHTGLRVDRVSLYLITAREIVPAKSDKLTEVQSTRTRENTEEQLLRGFDTDWMCERYQQSRNLLQLRQSGQ